MHEAVKAWTRETLAKYWVKDYGGRIDMEGNWITENGRVFKWELRAAKPHEPWQFASSFCMALAAIRQTSPNTLAENLAATLTAEAPVGWSFEALNGYVNAYFRPHSLGDYLRKSFRLEDDLFKEADSDSYVLYRLDILQKALVVRGVTPLPLDADLSQACLERFSDLFLKPDLLEEWQHWCKKVRQMTAEGRLKDLSSECEQALLAFIQAIV